MSFSFGHTVISMVTKHAVPPIKFETGSARNTPSVPNPIAGSKMVSGITIITFRNREKKTACFDLPKATNVDCPANWSAIMKIPKKYSLMAGTPFPSNSGSLLNR